MMTALGLAGWTPAGRAQEAAEFQRLTPRPPVLRASDFRLPASQTLPEIESYQQAVFSGSVSGIPKDEGIDRLTAPPYTVLLRQSFALLDRSTGALYHNGQASGGAIIKSPAALVWEPGRATISTETNIGNRPGRASRAAQSAGLRLAGGIAESRTRKTLADAGHGRAAHPAPAAGVDVRGRHGPGPTTPMPQPASSARSRRNRPHRPF